MRREDIPAPAPDFGHTVSVDAQEGRAECGPAGGMMGGGSRQDKPRRHKKGATGKGGAEKIITAKFYKTACKVQLTLKRQTCQLSNPAKKTSDSYCGILDENSENYSRKNQIFLNQSSSSLLSVFSCFKEQSPAIVARCPIGQRSDTHPNIGQRYIGPRGSQWKIAMGEGGRTELWHWI
jgi:hypothetical protein